MTRNKSYVLLMFFCIISLLLAGCFDVEKEKTKVLKLVQGYYDSQLLEDIDSTMSFYDKNSSFYFNQYQLHNDIFKFYNLNYVIKGYEFESVQKKSIVIKINIEQSGVDNEKKSYYENFIQKITFSPDANGQWKISKIEDGTINVES